MIGYFKIRAIKITLFVFVLLFVLLSLMNVKVFGNIITYDDSNTAGYSVLNSEKTYINTATHMKDTGRTILDGVFYDQQVNVLTQSTNEDSKLVTWAIKNSDGSGFVRRNIADIARDYEVNHPGWKVLGGINADQYYPLYGTGGHTNGSDYFYPQPYGPLIADGEKWFSVSATPYGGNGTYIAGFLNDGSNDQIVEGRTNWEDSSSIKVSLSGLYLSIINQYGEVESKFKIDKFNETPSEGESSVYSGYYVDKDFQQIDVSGNNLFVVEDAELSYVSNSITYTYKKNPKDAQNAFFGKGVISSSASTTSLGKHQFAINSNNQEITSALAVGKRILVQFEYEGIMNDVESATAYHAIMRQDGKDVNNTSPYNTTRYPRAFFGRTSNGKMVLVAIDGRQASNGMNGTNQYEGNAVLKNYGVVEAYQMDGGGSVTMVVRDNGGFKVVNSPSDGSPRAVLSGLFFVTRDVNLEVNQTACTNTSVTLNAKVTKTYERQIEEVYIEVDSKQYKVENETLTINDLEPNTIYNYRLFVKDASGKEATDYTGTFKTSKRPPKVKIVEYTNVDGVHSFTPIFDDLDNTVTTATLIVEGVSYELLDGKFTVDNYTETDSIKLIYKFKLSDFEEEATEEFVNPQYYTTVFFEYTYIVEDEFLNNIYK